MSKKLGINNPLENNALFADPAETKAEETKKPETKRKVGRPTKPDLVREPGAKQGLPVSETRATFILPVEAVENLKAYAYTKDVKIKDALTEMINKFIADYEADPNNEPLLRRGGKK